MLTSMTMRLVIFAYVFLLIFFCFRGVGGAGEGGWGDVDVHGNDFLDVSSDTSLLRPRLFCDGLLSLSCHCVMLSPLSCP